MSDLPDTKLLFQENPDLLCAEATVLARESAAGTCRVALDRTLFYPTGGGQPHDTGFLEAGKKRFAVEDVTLEDGVVWHHLNEAPKKGAKVLMEVDSHRRMDHRQQHTGQHLLSALALRDWGLDTVSFHLGEKVCHIDLDGPMPSPETIRDLQQAANEIIVQGLPIEHREIPREEWQEKAQRQKDLPEEVGEMVRVCSIGELDHNACGGTHLTNTQQLMACSLLGAEKARGGCRLFFLFGHRVIARLNQSLDLEKQLKRILSCGPEAWAALLTSREEERRRLIRERDQLKEALLPARAMQLVKAAKVEEDYFLIQEHLEQFSAKDLKKLADAIYRFPQKFVIKLTAEYGSDRVFFYTMSEGLDFPLQSTFEKDLGKFDGKGGGKGTSFQGKAPL